MVQRAKKRYLDKTLQKHKVKLSWCDLLPGEDLCQALIDKKFRSRTLADLIGDGTPYQYGSTQIFPVTHPGYCGSKARGKEQMD